MSERDTLLSHLVAEVLGPRFGQYEFLSASLDPRNEYITGVLAPAQEQREPDPDADVDQLVEEVSDDEDQGAEGPIIAAPSAFSPALDPKAQPRSIGLTFVVSLQSAVPRIDICVSWARYSPGNNGWQRQPKASILRSVNATSNMKWDVADGVAVFMRVRRQPNKVSHYRVSIYLVNMKKVDPGEKLTTVDFMFQPQIRVNCVNGTDLVPMDTISELALNDPLQHEDNQLAMLYRYRTALARGHMCGAIWKAIDPERKHPTINTPNTLPFVWIDRALVSLEDQHKFSPPDVRTEFVPTYSIESPVWDWPQSVGPEPLLDPLALSESWDPETLCADLRRLTDGYRRWIEAQRRDIGELPHYWQIFAEENLRQCEAAATRIDAGIAWLKSDPETRLAFCFANKAIAMQSIWSRDKVVPWRTFQLAFILLNIEAIVNPESQDRDICDLLWFPTGGGKTEAYLGLAAFTLAFRRRRARNLRDGDQAGRGMGVLSRYTLRLLTIQQFRRAIGIITACEVLRVANLDDSHEPRGWRPRDCDIEDDFIWGGVRFSAGLWVGGGVTPNILHSFTYQIPSNNQYQYVAGALDILQGVTSSGYEGHNTNLKKSIRNKRISAEGEPAQVLSCPVCNAVTAIAEEGLPPGVHTIHIVYTGGKAAISIPSVFNFNNLQVLSAKIHLLSNNVRTISLMFENSSTDNVRPKEVDRWWRERISTILGVPEHNLLAARPSRPGYFLTTYENSQSNEKYNSFEIYCPDPACHLNQNPWAEQVPLEVSASTAPSGARILFDSSAKGLLPTLHGLRWQTIEPEFRANHVSIGNRIPIPAYTVDDQIYHRCPSLIIATVDKFARLAFEPKAGAIFGNVTHYHARWGYYREGCPPDQPGTLRPTFADHPAGYNAHSLLHVRVAEFHPPDLIIQDELHLIEGPLGSMVGLYETVVDALCERITSRGKPILPKYVASTATIRQATDQVQSLFARTLAQFPPSGVNVDDRFFAKSREVDVHPLEDERAGRLYVAIAAPGKGAQTPIVRIWSALLQGAKMLHDNGATEDLDRFWTLVGYFNALRELAGAAALYRQDVRERINEQYGKQSRLLSDQAVELSSRANSLALPGLLERLAQAWQEDVVLATSMFGTGVDINRLGLMVVHGQPKTTSSYIQATGRVGRQGGGLVVTFFRASRPRDLDHYEFFTGYHRTLYRSVEPITVTPFAPRARERALGAIAVAMLRQASQLKGVTVKHNWRIQQRIQGAIFSRAAIMADYRREREVEILADIVERRALSQPEARRPLARITKNEMLSELDRWYSIAHDHLRRTGKKRGTEVTDEFVYSEPAMIREPQRGVVLGDAQHQLNDLPVAYENAPTSLRDVEETTQFKG